MSTRSWLLFFVVAVSACSDGTLPSAPPPPPPPISVAVAYCIQPAWVAFQDGDGAWTRAQPVLSGSNTTFRSEFSAGRGGIATLSRAGDNMTVLSVLYGTPAELVTAGDTNPRDCGPAPAKTLLGTVAQLDTNETAFVSASCGGASTCPIAPRSPCATSRQPKHSRQPSRRSPSMASARKARCPVRGY